jgi:prepilin-type N-terminal cleavage/methylation domain-containing protein
MTNRGFTLTELILGMVIMSITALAFAPLLTQAVGSYSMATTRSRAVNDTRHAMFQMTRELLQIVTDSVYGQLGEQYGLHPQRWQHISRQFATDTKCRGPHIYLFR